MSIFKFPIGRENTHSTLGYVAFTSLGKIRILRMKKPLTTSGANWLPMQRFISWAMPDTALPIVARRLAC